jgi:glyceraldehyde 3-phosphate dehydrogenase
VKKLAINGFGRIGRAAFKVAFEQKDFEIVAINDLTDTKTLAHLLKHDTAYGLFRREIEVESDALIVNGKRIPVYALKEPLELPWKTLEVDVVLECTGRFTDKEGATKHLTAGAKKVVLSAPAKGEDGTFPTYIMGVNMDQYKGETVISNASCTTNSLAPIAEVMHRTFGVEKALMTTIHSYTADQTLQDGPHKDLRRARAAAQNMVPTTTGAAIAVTEVLPELRGKFDGLAVRVPTIVVSLSDATFLLKKKVTVEEINEALTIASQDPRYARILAVTSEPLVSSDFIGNPYSVTVDLGLTKVVDGDLVKITGWYDNEWGYAHRLVELATYISA